MFVNPRAGIARSNGGQKNSHDDAVEHAVPETHDPAQVVAAVAFLTTREVECMEWLARGLQDGQIAERLKLSRSTVRLHIKNARAKLRSKTREQALVRALQLGLIVP